MAGVPNPIRSHAEPTAAYIHVPFCRHRCGYCNFTLTAGRDDLIDRYLAALAHELTVLRSPKDVSTLFFGGGTPSHLPPEQLRRLFTIAAEWFWLAPDGESSLEANPLDISSERIEVFGEYGINRLSLGVQSFRAEKLRLLERDHSADDVRRVVDLVRKRFAGDLSIDLIFGAPGETLDDWRRELDDALTLRPEHISLYGLTFERGTTFWSRLRRGELIAQDEETERAMYLDAVDRLTASGYEHYETSNFARPGKRCRHNETYWAARGYYAAGPGAARYVGGTRETNHRSTTAWLARIEAGQSPVAETETLNAEDRAREALVLGLRRVQDGIDRAAFRDEFGYDVGALGGDELTKLVAAGLLEINERRLRLSREGLLLSDWIWSKFLRC